MSTNVDNRLLKSNDTSTGMSLKSALGLEQEQEQSRPASMNKAATANYLSSLRREQDEVGDNLSRSMNKLNQSLSQAAAKSDTVTVDEQAQKMAVYSKLAGKLIDRDSSLQEKVAQNLSSNSNVVRSKDASESLQKAMDNLPPALKEGTQAGKDLAKFMVENLVTLSDRKQMGAGLERDLAVRQISIPKNQPNSRIQQASSKVLSASIEYVKNNQPEVLAKIPPETKAESQTSSTTTIKAQEHSAPAQTKDTTYISALKAQRHQSAINNDQEPKAQAPQDKISAEISKRIHSLIAQAATTAKSGNLISLSPEEAERFDRTQSPQSSDNLKRIFGQNNNSSSNTSSVNNGADGELPPPSTTNKQAPTNVRQLSLAELSARANQLQTQFREERQRIVQEGKLPDPAQMPEYTFDKASVKATLTQAHIQQQQQEQQRAQQTSSLYESLARARSAISAHSSQYANQTQQAEQPAPQQQQPAQPQTTEQKPVVQDNKAPAAQQQPAQSQTTEQKPVAQDNKAPAAQQQPAQHQTTEQKPVAQDNKAPAAQQPAQSQTTEQKPVVQDNKAPAAQQPAQPQTTEQKPVVQDNKAPATQQPAQPQTTEQKPSNIELNHSSLNFGKTDVNLSFNAIQSSTYGGMDIMPGMTIPVSHFGQFDNDTIQPNNKALEALKVQARLLESQLKSAEQELAQLKQNATLESKPTLNTSQPVADGDEQQLSSGSNVANKPSIVPNTEVPKGPSGVPVADGDESVVEQKVDTVVKPPVMTTEQPVNSNNNLAGAGAPTVEHSNRTNPFAKLYGVMQQGHYDEANIQQPNLNDKGNSSNTLGFNTALAKPMDGNSQSSQTQSNSNQYVPSGSGSMMSEASDEAQFSNNTIIVKGPVEAEAASEEPSIIDKPKHATNASATDVSKTKEFLAQNAQEAQEKEAVVQEKQATKEALEQNIKENKQEQKIQEEQVVQEEFVATMQARAQSTQQAIEQAQIQANLQAQQVQSNQQLANGKLYENGQINQFSRLYQQTISEQNAQQTRVLGSSQVNTVGDTNIKATGATIATTTTNINVETQEQGQQNTGATNLANRNTVGHTTVDQSNRLSGGDQSAVSANQLNQGTQVQGQTQAQAQAQAQGQAQVSTPAQVQGQPQAQAQAQAQVQGQAQTPVQGQAQAPVQGQAQVQTNVPNSNVQSQAVQPNVNVGAVSGTGAVSQMQAQVQAQAQAQAQAQIQAQIQANGNAIQMPNGLSTPVVNLDEDSLQDEIIKNVMQTVPSDDLDEFGIKNNNNLTSAPLSGVVADTDLTEDNNTFSQILNKGATEPNALSALGDSSKVVPTNSALGAAQITSGQNDPIPEESVVNNVATPKEGGILRRLASLFGRKNNVEEAVSSSSNESKSVDPSKAALDNLLNKSEQTASSQNSAATNIRMNSYESLVNKLQMAAADEALPPKMQEQAQNLLKSLQNPVNDLKTVSSWLNFVTGPMSPSSSQALALHQWAFMLLCIRFEQIGKNVEKFLKKTQGGTDKIAKLDTAIKDSAKVAQELDDVTVSKSHDLLKETFSQVERMQQQMQSIPQDQSVLRYIPLPPNYQGGKEGSFSAQKRKDEDGGTSWHLNFNLDLQDMGALQVKVKLRFPEIQMSFVAEKFETLQKVQQHMPELNAKLKEIGLTSTGSNARLGHINFNQDQAPSPSNNGSRFKYEGNAFNVDA